jgi:dihydroneopterin aldolase/2-amino-4-hydroxy-6-hydroxymethyldihydropteridine diphosphokinase
MKHTVLLGLGSNKGNSIELLAAAIRGIGLLPQTSVNEISGVYQTEPVGGVVQDDFLNVCIAVQTGLHLEVFHAGMKDLEKRLGRSDSSVKWGPREIDIDLLFFDAAVVATETLTVPHREIVNRKFVLRPLSDIAPVFVHPVERRSIAQLNAECADAHAVTFSESFSTQLSALIHDPIAHSSV